MNKKRTSNIITVIVLVLLAVVLFAYPHMPDTIPVHWGSDGAVDGWGSKKWIFAMWAIIPGIDFLTRFAEKIDPKGENYKKFEKVFVYFRIAIALFMSSLVVVTVISAFDPRLIDMNKLMFPYMGGMFMLLGNYMPKVKHNYTFGIKTPHTLASEIVWNKTHRMAGPLWVVAGIGMMLCGFLKGDMAIWFMIAVILTVVVIPVVYAYMEYKKEFPGLK